MTVRGRAVSRASRWFAASVAIVFVCSAAAVALASTGAVVTSRQSQVGKVVASRAGLTLYMFHQDWAGKSYCYGTCTKTWSPDITSSRPTTPSSSGLNSKLLGTIRRTNGTLQVTYNGHPLYFYSGDTEAGAIAGEGRYEFHGYWYVLGPDGKAIKPFNKCAAGCY